MINLLLCILASICVFFTTFHFFASIVNKYNIRWLSLFGISSIVFNAFIDYSSFHFAITIIGFIISIILSVIVVCRIFDNFYYNHLFRYRVKYIKVKGSEEVVYYIFRSVLGLPFTSFEHIKCYNQLTLKNKLRRLKDKDKKSKDNKKKETLEGWLSEEELKTLEI